MSIPLEDTVADIIGKAQRGLGLDDTELARLLQKSAYELSVLKEVQNAPPHEVDKLAAALELDGRSLQELAQGKYTPVVRAPDPGFFMANTKYGDMTVNAYLVWDKETKLAAAFDTGAAAGPHTITFTNTWTQSSGVVVFLASDDARWITGQIIAASGGAV